MTLKAFSNVGMSTSVRNTPRFCSAVNNSINGGSMTVWISATHADCVVALAHICARNTRTNAWCGSLRANCTWMTLVRIDVSDPRPCARRATSLLDLALDVHHERDDDVLLGAEVVVDGALPDVGGQGDVVDRAALDAVPGEQGEAGGDDPVAGVLLLAGPPGQLRCDHGQI